MTKRKAIISTGNYEDKESGVPNCAYLHRDATGEVKLTEAAVLVEAFTNELRTALMDLITPQAEIHISVNSRSIRCTYDIEGYRNLTEKEREEIRVKNEKNRLANDRQILNRLKKRSPELFAKPVKRVS